MAGYNISAESRMLYLLPFHNGTEHDVLLSRILIFFHSVSHFVNVIFMVRGWKYCQIVHVKITNEHQKKQ